MTTNLHESVARYYANKLAEHGDTPLGVDWNGAESQARRFRELSRLLQDAPPGYSINDLGCGYGAYFEYLAAEFAGTYLGIDVSAEMIAVAQRRFADDARAKFAVGTAPSAVASFGVASGIFNVRLEHDDDTWASHIRSTLDVLNETSAEGFAANFLTSYSDEGRKRGHLYYANPGEIFDLCKRRYSRQVALLHDYGLYEFTIIVRRDPS